MGGQHFTDKNYLLAVEHIISDPHGIGPCVEHKKSDYYQKNKISTFYK